MFLIGTIVAIASARSLRVARSADMDEEYQNIARQVDAMSEGDMERMSSALGFFWNEAMWHEMLGVYQRNGFIPEAEIEEMKKREAAWFRDEGDDEDSTQQ